MNIGISDFLNASRWIAAFFVVLGHVYGVSMVDYYHAVHPSLPLQGLYFFGGFGHIAVVVFFVVSGFLVGGRAILNFRERGFAISDYFVHRFSRIYVVLIPALIVGYVLDWCGIKLFNASEIYTHADPFYDNPLGNNIANHLSFYIFIGNLMQLQTILVSSLGSNAPLWSLANEWWYYVLFGLGMTVYRPGRMFTRLVAGSAIVVTVMILPLTISLWFVLWGVGAGAAVVDRYWGGWSFIAGAAITVVSLIAVRWANAWQAHMGMATHFAMDLAVALAYSAALVCAKNLKHPRRFGSFHRALASFSYTLYLVHFPAMMFVAAFIKGVLDIGFVRQPSVMTMIYAGTLLAILYGYAWIFAAFTEAHTNAVRSSLSVLIPQLFYRTDYLTRIPRMKRRI